MLDIQHYSSFIAAIILFQVIPGPGTVVILNATARQGLAAGMAAVLGTICGDFIFMTAAVAGLAGIMQSNPVIFQALQWAGAGYLVWSGLKILVKSKTGRLSAEQPSPPPRSHFRQACAVSLTNPKVMLFFVAFFPLFLRVDASSLTLGVMMAHVTVLSLVYQTTLVLLGNAVATRLKALPWVRRIVSRLAGLALIGFGVKLAVNNR